MAEADDTLNALSEAYSILLQIPFHSMRFRAQSAMCQCRDKIAVIRGVNEQEIQDEFELKFQPEGQF